MAQHSARRRTVLALGAIAVVGAAVSGAAMAARDDDAKDTAITGDALAKATAAALTETGGGRVTGTEAGDEESAYEVEVTLDDGTQVDVQLDGSFQVVSTEEDHEDGD